MVLLSPAAASFDMYADYAARGDAFRAAVAGTRRGRMHERGSLDRAAGVASSRSATSRASGVRRERHHVSHPLLTAVLALVAIGVVMVYSASSVQSYLRSSDPSAQGIQQAIWAVLGLGAMLWPAAPISACCATWPFPSTS